MPIRASQRARYPKDWKAISLRIRERAENRCECTGECGHTHLDANDKPGRCNAPNGELIIRDRQEPEIYTVHTPCGGCAGGDPDCARAVRVVLTVAHLDHTPENCADKNLRAWCQRCHLSYDRYEHGHNARETRRARKAIGELFTIGLAALLTGCPASLRSPEFYADCCEPGDAGADAGCEWVPLNYTVPVGTDSFADDDRACQRAGLEPYR